MMQTGGIDTRNAAANQAGGDAPLVFQFSKSEAKGTQSWINAHRLSILAGMTGGVSMLISGIQHKNPMRKAAAAVTMYGMVADLILADKKSPVLGELTLAHGDWTQNGDVMQHTMQGKLPDHVKDEIEGVFTDSPFPKNSIMLDYDKKKNQTRISIPTAIFSKIQEHLNTKIAQRQQAFAVLLDTGRHTPSSGASSVCGLSLAGVDDDTVRNVQTILRHEFNIHSDLTYGESGYCLSFDPPNAKAFDSIASAYHADAKHFIVRSGIEDDYAPGFIETLTRPDKHPKQHGVLIGGILSNALRIGAGLWEEEGHAASLKGKKDLWESMSSVWSMMTYLIDLQPEIKKKDGKVVAYSHVQYGPVENAAHKIADTFDDRPLLGSLVVKAPVTYMRVMSAWQPGRNDPMKKINAVSDAVRHLLTATIHKGDYGR